MIGYAFLHYKINHILIMNLILIIIDFTRFIQLVDLRGMQKS